MNTAGILIDKSYTPSPATPFLLINKICPRYIALLNLNIEDVGCISFLTENRMDYDFVTTYING